MTQSEFDAIIRVADDREQLALRLCELVDKGRIDNFLIRLRDTALDLPEDRIESAALAVFDTGDKLTTGLWPVHQLLTAGGSFINC